MGRLADGLPAVNNPIRSYFDGRIGEFFGQRSQEGATGRARGARFRSERSESVVYTHFGSKTSMTLKHTLRLFAAFGLGVVVDSRLWVDSRRRPDGFNSFVRQTKDN